VASFIAVWLFLLAQLQGAASGGVGAAGTVAMVATGCLRTG